MEKSSPPEKSPNGSESAKRPLDDGATGDGSGTSESLTSFGSVGTTSTDGTEENVPPKLKTRRVKFRGYPAVIVGDAEPEIRTKHGTVHPYDDLCLSVYTTDRGCARMMVLAGASLLNEGDQEWTFLIRQDRIAEVAVIMGFKRG